MTTSNESPAQLIDAKIAALGDWRADTLKRLRELILATDDAVVETWKWDVPVWERDGILCTGETYKAKVKLTFPHGAALADPKGLFNSSLEGKVRRAIDFGPADEVDAAAFKALIREAVKFNAAGRK
ncbi:DUF1801 domain-containing protein [Roseateles sp. P5_E7]